MESTYRNCKLFICKQKLALKLWEDVVIASGENAARAKERYLDSRERHNLGNVKIAGAIPPLAESYRHDLVGPYKENVMQYQIIIRALLDYVDLFICETMSTIEESKAAVEAAIKVMKGKSVHFFVLTLIQYK